MTRFASRTFLLTILLFLFCLQAWPQTPANTTVYLYDEIGRLKAVITPSGEAAVYNYDAAGNIMSITRQLSTTVSIIEFTPDKGPVGTAVTIFGTGFSLTPAQNSVSFNGVAATVTAASGTQLTAVVPAGAATGPITVTTPNGTAVSANNFEVLQSLAITGFTPTIGTPGTAVQITGTDFDPVAANNQVKFNITSAIASAATATSINTTVPAGATSGHITVTTTGGTAVSSGDFFVPPSPFTAASVDFTSRMAIGETKQVLVSVVNRIALLVFDGTAGQRIALQAAGSTISSSTVRVIKPDNTNLLNPTSLSGNWFVDTLTLPVTGTYTIVIDPNSTATGSMNLTLHGVSPDAGAVITAGGPPVTVTTTTPGQNANVTFEGTTGQRVSLELNNVTISSSSVTIRKPDGTTLATQATVGTTGSFFDTMTLPATGTYSIFIDPKIAATGSMTLNLYIVPPDVSGTIVIGGAHVPVTISAPGQNAQLTFSGTAGQIVELDWNGTLQFATRPVFLKPDGATLIDDFGFWDDDDIYRLPVSGAYTIRIDGAGSSTGTTTLALYEIPEPVSASIVADGPPLTVNIPTFGQFARVTFNGTAGQRVSLRISDVKLTWAYVEFLDPNGNWIGDSDAFPEWDFDGSLGDPVMLIDTITLSANGTYTINVYPDFEASGNLTLQLFNVPPDVTATIVPGGPPVTVTTTVPGQNARVTFNGTAGQRLSLKLTESIFPFSFVDIIRPDQSVLSGPQTFPDGGFEDTFTLPFTGTYTIVVDAYLGNPGNTTMRLYEVPPVITGTLAINGPPVTITTTAPGHDAEMTFSGTAGQRISLKVSAPIDSDLFLIRPNNQNLLPSRFTRQIGPVQAELFETVILPTTGTYKVRVDTWEDPGSITFDLYEVPPDVPAGTITIGGPPVTVTSTAPRQNRTLTFNGTTGQMVHLKIDNDNSWLNLVWIFRPDGFLLNRRLADAAATKLVEGATLPMSGAYTILTEFFGAGDSVTLHLAEGSGDLTGTIAMDGQPVTINVPTSRQIARYSFTATPGQRVGLRRTDITMPSGVIGLSGTDTECCFQAFVKSEGRGSDRFSVNLLPSTGTQFLVSVDPEFDFTGGGTLRLFPVPPDLTGTIAVNGPPVNLTTTTPGQNASLTFQGTTGQQVTLHVTNNTIGKIVFEITRPTGLQQSYWIDSGASFDLPTQLLPTPGTYVISVNPLRANTGTVTLTATSP